VARPEEVRISFRCVLNAESLDSPLKLSWGLCSAWCPLGWAHSLSRNPSYEPSVAQSTIAARQESCPWIWGRESRNSIRHRSISIVKGSWRSGIFSQRLTSSSTPWMAGANALLVCSDLRGSRGLERAQKAETLRRYFSIVLALTAQHEIACPVAEPQLKIAPLDWHLFEHVVVAEP
jgi:hypothetical protein